MTPNPPSDEPQSVKIGNIRKIFSSSALRFAAIALTTKIILLYFGYQAYQLIVNKPVKETIWVHWDAVHYLKLAEFGYTAAGEERFLIVFFPLFPMLILAVNVIFDNFVMSAFIVSAVASVFAAISLGELVKLDFSEKAAEFAVFFLFIFPTAYFLHIPYTESLFLALCIGSFFEARRGAWVLAGLLGMFACLTKINGLFIFPALLCEVFDKYRETKKFDRTSPALLLVPCGFLLYLGLNYHIAGDPLMFLAYQRENWQKYLRFPWQGIRETYYVIFNADVNNALMRGLFEMFFVVIGFAAIVFGWKIMRNSYRVWMILNWLIFVSTSFILSVPRYTLIMFPLFMVMARAAEKRFYLRLIFTVVSLLYLALFTTQYVRGWWAF